MAASCNLGTINAKVSPLECGGRRLIRTVTFASFSAKTSPEISALKITRPWKSLNPSCSATSLETLGFVDNKESKNSGTTSELIPNFEEVESLLTTICDTTSIAEVELKLSGFRLLVRRSLDAEVSAPVAETTGSYTEFEGSDSNVSVSAPSLAITKLETYPQKTLLEKAADEGMALVLSPKVGFFRRCRTIKGKLAPPPVKEKQTVKEGQVLCYIAQLGGEYPVESDVAGEVIKILREDGEPVGYNDPLVAVLPSFPGIKKLQ